MLAGGLLKGGQVMTASYNMDVLRSIYFGLYFAVRALFMSDMNYSSWGGVMYPLPIPNLQDSRL